MKILSGARGEAQVKRLAASFIPKFYIYFPDLWDTAMDAIMDLCEETDPAVCTFFFYGSYDRFAKCSLVIAYRDTFCVLKHVCGQSYSLSLYFVP